MVISPARAAAFDILLRVETTDAYASELLHSSRFDSLSSADHGLLTELVMGVLRWRSVLDTRMAEHVTQPLSKLDLEVLTALRLAVYQILFLDRIPSHAAVNESVELVKQARKRSAAGMVNAVLRKVNRDSIESPSAMASHPKWLVERWMGTYGTEATERICSYDLRAPKTTIRATDSRLIDDLQREGIQLEPGSLLANARVVTGGDVTRTQAFHERRLIIQDEASQLVVLLVGNGTSILDCCAAPGGKTRILAQQNPEAMVVALELHPHRAALLKKLVHTDNIRVISADVRQMPLTAKFDRVLVDAPCSGTGTLARNPEIKWRLEPEDIRRLQEYQLQILLAATDRVANGGRLLYSTCSLEPQENSEVVEKALAARSGFRKLQCRDELVRLSRDQELVIDDLESLLDGPYLRTIPGIHCCDGFFAAILERA